MPIASGLPGTDGREFEAVFVRNVSKLPATIKAGKYATTADDYGAIGAWRDDAGKHRCDAQRHLRTIESKTYTTLKQVKKWYTLWLKRIANGSYVDGRKAGAR